MQTQKIYMRGVHYDSRRINASRTARMGEATIPGQKSKMLQEKEKHPENIHQCSNPVSSLINMI